MKRKADIFTRFLVLFLVLTSQLLVPKAYAVTEIKAEYFPESDIVSIKEGRLNGYLITPKKIKQNGIVVIVSGSDGEYDFTNARIISAAGYRVFCLSYFNKPNLPKQLINAPIDVFEDLLSYLKKNSITVEPITILGTSMGSQFAQYAANIYPEIDNIILIAPGCYNFPIPYFSSSSWSYKGKHIPAFEVDKYPDFNTYRKVHSNSEGKKETSYVDYYKALIDSKKEGSEPIDLSNFKGQILVIAGEDDKLWPSAEMGKVIKEKNKDNTEIHLYEDAGHSFYTQSHNGILLGGTVIGNHNAKVDSRLRIFEFLSKHHK